MPEALVENLGQKLPGGAASHPPLPPPHDTQMSDPGGWGSKVCGTASLPLIARTIHRNNTQRSAQCKKPAPHCTQDDKRAASLIPVRIPT